MATISDIRAKVILNSKGAETIEVILRLGSGAEAKASVPQGVSAGSHEAVSLSAKTAANIVEKKILPLVRGLSVKDQGKIDDRMIEADGTDTKKKLGGNAILAVSLVVARAAAGAERIPLWQYLRRLSGLRVPQGAIPRLFVNVIEGGVHAANNLAIQEHLIIPRGKTLSDAIQGAVQFYSALREYLEAEYGKVAVGGGGDEGGFAPLMKTPEEPFYAMQSVAKKVKGYAFDFGIDAAAENISIKPDALTKLYVELCKKFKLLYIEDPFKEDNFKRTAELHRKLGDRVLVAGDDLSTTNLSRMKKADAMNAINAVIIKPNQIGTVTETLEAVKFAVEKNWKYVVSHRGGETNDNWIADFAYGLGAYGFKLGAPCRGERVSKYNRLLEIEREA